MNRRKACALFVLWHCVVGWATLRCACERDAPCRWDVFVQVNPTAPGLSAPCRFSIGYWSVLLQTPLYFAASMACGATVFAIATMVVVITRRPRRIYANLMAHNRPARPAFAWDKRADDTAAVA